jgi:predicted amidohydrolase YtcJ
MDATREHLLITGAEIAGHRNAGLQDVRLAAGRIVAMGRELPEIQGEPALDARGGALLPGLHDHHIHLLALAAAGSSARCGPPAVRSPRQLAEALSRCEVRQGWIRGIGYHESVAGELDRWQLDRLAPELQQKLIRIQHRSGALWVLNSAGVRRLGLEEGGALPKGVERDARGRVTGRLLRLDDWLRERLGGDLPPDLGPVARRLASYGVTGVTDATAGNSEAELATLTAAVASGQLPQRLLLMGRLELPPPRHPDVKRGAVKLILNEYDPPEFDALEQLIRGAHRANRPVAFHCVTRSELVLAAAALAAAGSQPGDRIEHAAVAPPDAIELLAALPVTVVTQPNFIRERGDAYVREVDASDLPWLYRGRGFLEADIPLGGGTDAPFGDPDPWLAIRAAVERRNADGVRLGAEEALTPERALALFASPPEAPGAPSRALDVGSEADLCLLDRSWTRAREELSSALVAATLRRGRVIWPTPDT